MNSGNKWLSKQKKIINDIISATFYESETETALVLNVRWNTLKYFHKYFYYL